MKVTVLILAYNDAVLVERAIQSALAQTYTDLEILLLDNGSTDNTPQVLRQFTSDPRVRIVTNAHNQRSEFATAQALKVKSPYLSFLFSDDLYEPERIARSVKALQNAPDCAAVFSNNLLINEHGQTLSENIPTQFQGDVSTLTSEEHLNHFMTKGNSLHPCAMLIRSADYQELGGFKPYLHRIGDMTFFAKLLSHKKVLFLPDKLQKITVLTSNRNESYQNAINKTAVAFERLRFLEEFRAEPMLLKLDSVFPALRPKMGTQASLAVREFCLGELIFSIPTSDHRLFGMRCIYEAFERDSASVNAHCLARFDQSFAQFCFELQSNQTSSHAVAAYKVRKFIHGVPGGAALINCLRPLVQFIRPS